jgi:hypothetical protein
MSTRPEYYSGRGATTTDLSSQILEKIHTAIVKNVDEKAGKAFVKMVAAIPVLSATDFLITLHALEQNKWVWKESLLGNQKGIHYDSHEGALFTLFAVACRGHERDDTWVIRGDFLAKHQKGFKYNPYPSTGPWGEVAPAQRNR